MKQCPNCDELFADEQSFCDLDGTPLVDETESLRLALQRANLEKNNNSSKGAWSNILIGALLGVVLCLIVIVVYTVRLIPEPSGQSDKSTPTVRQQPVETRQVASTTSTDTRSAIEDLADTDEGEAEPSPSPAAEEEKPNVASGPTPTFTSGPISTGTMREERGHAFIKMKDGSSIEVEAAWEDGNAVWYRRSGVVSFVERDLVETITEAVDRRAVPQETVNP